METGGGHLQLDAGPGLAVDGHRVFAPQSDRPLEIPGNHELSEKKGGGPNRRSEDAQERVRASTEVATGADRPTIRCMTPAIRVRGLVKTYPGKPPVEAVQGLDLEVQVGECFGLLGPNGAG